MPTSIQPRIGGLLSSVLLAIGCSQHLPPTPTEALKITKTDTCHEFVRNRYSVIIDMRLRDCPEEGITPPSLAINEQGTNTGCTFLLDEQAFRVTDRLNTLLLLTPCSSGEQK